MGLTISRVLHAGYIFECDGTEVAFDPIFENPFSVNCYAFPSVEFDDHQIKNLGFKAVFISHYHEDHCSLESLNFLDRRTPIYIYCIYEELASLIKELGFLHIYHLEIDRPITIGPMKITACRALDDEIDCLFHVTAEGLHVLNVVDAWIDPQTLTKLARNSPWDLVLWPFQTMREIDILTPSRAPKADLQIPHEWIQQLRILKPRIVVPSSCQFLQEDWSWYNHAFFPISYQQFQQQVESVLPEVQILRLNPAQAVTLNKDSIAKAAPLKWIRPIGPQNTDYQYKPDLRPPSTQQIATHFAPLTELQTERVLVYCRSEILDKYNSLAPPVDEYFQKPRKWQLSLYDHQGTASQLFYQLQNGLMTLAPDDQEPLSWLTELPIFKLYSALENGESLTSMYLRINDTVFDPQIEKEINSADTMEDPLIRCLFHGVFAAYQQAQLKKLKQR